MKIAYLTAEYSHQNLPPAGGIGSFVKVMADSLCQKGHDVTVFVCFSNEDKVWTDGAIKVVQIKNKYRSWGGVILNRIYINKIIKQYVNDYAIQVLESPDWEGLHAFINLKIPVITRIHGSVTYFNTLEKRKTPRLINYLENKAIKKSDAIISVSDFAGKLTKEVFNIDHINIVTIYNGTNINKGQDNNTFSINRGTILYLGTLIRKKGVLELPYIFEEVLKKKSNVKLLIVGKDSVDYKLKKSTWDIMKSQLSEKALQKVSYLGVVPFSEVKKIISSISVCVLPSFAETFGLTTIESMAAGKVVIASDYGWNREIIRDGVDGYLVDPKNHKSYAQKILNVINDENLARSIGDNANLRVSSKFNQSLLVEENINFYKSIISEK